MSTSNPCHMYTEDDLFQYESSFTALFPISPPTLPLYYHPYPSLPLHSVFASFPRLRLRLRLPRLMESLRPTQAFQIALSSKPTVARVRIGSLAIRYPPRPDRGFFLSLRTCCVNGRNVDGARIPDGSSPDPEAEIVNDASALGIGQVLYTGILSPHYNTPYFGSWFWKTVSVRYRYVSA